MVNNILVIDDHHARRWGATRDFGQLAGGSPASAADAGDGHGRAAEAFDLLLMEPRGGDAGAVETARVFRPE